MIKIPSKPLPCVAEMREGYVREYRERERDKQAHNHSNSIFTSSRLKPFIYSEVYTIQRKEDTACIIMQFSCLDTAVSDIKTLSFGIGSHSLVSARNYEQKVKT